MPSKEDGRMDMTDMILMFSPCGNQSFRVSSKNGNVLGELYREVDGYYVYEPNRELQGYFSEQLLMELALKLSDLNQEWNDLIVRESRPAPLIAVLDETAEDPFINSRTGALI